MEWTNESFVDVHIAKLNSRGVDITKIKERSYELKTDTLEFFRNRHYASPVGTKAESIFWGIMWNPKSPPKFFMKPKNGDSKKFEIFPTFEFQNTVLPKYNEFARESFVSIHTDGILPWQRSRQRRAPQPNHDNDEESDDEEGNNKDNEDEDSDTEEKMTRLMKLHQNYFMYPSAIPSLKLGRVYGLWNTKSGAKLDLYWEWKSKYNFGRMRKQFLGFTYDPNVDFMYTRKTIPVPQTPDDVLMTWDLLNSVDAMESSFVSNLIQSMSNPYRTPWATIMTPYMELHYLSMLFKEIEKRKMIPLYALKQKIPFDAEQMQIFKQWYRKESEQQGFYAPISGDILANFQRSRPDLYRQNVLVSQQPRNFISRSDEYIQEVDNLKTSIVNHKAVVNTDYKDGIQTMQIESGYEADQFTPHNPVDYARKEQAFDDKEHWIYGIPSPDSALVSGRSRSNVSTETVQMRFANEMKSAFTEKQYVIEEFMNKALNACIRHNWELFFTLKNKNGEDINASESNKGEMHKQKNLRMDIDDTFEIVMEMQPIWNIPHQLLFQMLQYELFDRKFIEEIIANQMSFEYNRDLTESEKPYPKKRTKDTTETPSNQQQKKNKKDDDK